MLQTLIPSGAFIAGFCIKGEQELISCSKGRLGSNVVPQLGGVCLTFLFIEFGEFMQNSKVASGL
jgi:hypothetical protein